MQRILYTFLLLFTFSFVLGQTTFIIDNIPNKTPHDASLYMVGSFNEWNPQDSRYKLQKEGNNRYSVVLPDNLDNFTYKFTRGNWSSVEGDENGRAIPNRQYVRKRDGNLLHVSILTWEDLSGNAINSYTILLLLAAIQGIMIVIAINMVQDNNRKANLFLSIIIMLTSLSLLARVAVYDREVFQAYPKLLLLSDFIFFSYSPLFYFYIKSLLILPVESRFQKWYHAIGGVAQIFIYFPLFMMERQGFIDDVVDRTFVPLFAGLGVAALIFNLAYWFRCKHILKTYQQQSDNTQSFHQNLHYLHTVMNLKMLMLVVWAAALLLGIFYLLGFNLLWVVERSIDTVWAVLSIQTYFLGYYAMAQPEIFKMRPIEEIEKEEVEEKTALQEQEQSISAELENHQIHLVKLMEENKPFYNPKLSLAELADLTGITPHLLSKVINECFNKNFFEFVNDYRVEEFIELIKRNEHKHQTLLAVAMKVGFNSKTAFNRAFKKTTNLTPREYLKELQHEMVDI